MSPAPHRPSSDGPLRAVLLGMGPRGEAWLPVLAGPEAAALGVVPIAVCDLDPDRALKAMARAGQVLLVAPDLAQALALGPDIVIDCTTPNARLAIAREALRQGAHVLCEPPLAADETTALGLVGAAARAPGRLCVAYAARHQPGLQQLRNLVEVGSLGRPLSLRAEIAGADGGAALSHAILRGPATQAFDAARAILGCDALMVCCTERTLPGRSPEDGQEVDALFEMVDGSTFAFSGRASWIGASAGHEAWRLALDHGSADWESGAPVRVWTSGSSPIHLPQPDLRTGGLAGALESLVRSIRTGQSSGTGPRDAAASLSMVLSATRSAEQGGRPEPVLPLGLMSDASASPPPRSSRMPLSPEAP